MPGVPHQSDCVQRARRESGGRLNATFSPTLLNEFVASYTTDHIVLNNVGSWQRPNGICRARYLPGNGDGILPGINLVGDSATTAALDRMRATFQTALTTPIRLIPTGTMSARFGRHNLQFGAYAVFGQKNELGGELGAGSIPGYLTFDQTTSISTGNPFADLLLAEFPASASRTGGSSITTVTRLSNPTFRTIGTSIAV